MNPMMIYERFKTNILQPGLSADGSKKAYYSLYTLAFVLVFVFCFSWLLFSNKSFIWWLDSTGDGWRQHLRALSYYATYLRNIVRHLLSDHNLIIPDWDFNIGEGSDIVNALHYYVIGDPITLLSVFVPTRFMHYFLSASCVLRLYLAGIACSAFFFGTGIKSRPGALAGSIAYSFSLWGIHCAARHPYFLNPMIYFPLMLLGIEKIIRKEKPYLFIITAAISAASNFYFFYIIAVLAITYTIIRLAYIYRTDVKCAFLQLIRLGGYALVGVSLAAIIFLPVLFMFLQDSRLGSSQPFQLFYPLSYYSSLPRSLVSLNFDYWLSLGFTAPSVLASIRLFFDKKRNTLLKIYLIVCVALTLFPIAGRFLNGMSYPTNRWVWAFVLLTSYILATYWDDLVDLKKQNWIALFVASLILFVACLHFDKSRSASAFASMAFFFITLTILMLFSDREKTLCINTRSALMLALVMLSSVTTSMWLFATSNVAHVDEVADAYIVRSEVETANYAYSKEMIDNSKVRREWQNDEAKVIKNIAGSNFTRYSGRYATLNAGTSAGVSSTNYYWSISNPFVNNYRDALCMREPKFQVFQGYDDRTVPNTLAAVEYYTVQEQENLSFNKLSLPYGPGNREEYKLGIPYGFKYIDKINAQAAIKDDKENLLKELGQATLTPEQEEKLKETVENNILVYRNQYALPLGYCYDSAIRESDWYALNPAQRQQALLEAAVIPQDRGADTFRQYSPPSEDYRVPFEIVYDGTDFVRTDYGFVTTEDDVTIALALKNPTGNSETYVGFDNLDFNPTKQYDLYFGDDTVDPLKLYNKTNWEILDSGTRTEIRKERDYWDPVVPVDLVFESSAYVKKTLRYDPPDAPFSSGRHNYVVNMGYGNEAVSYIRLRLPTKGVYSFDDLSIYSVPMDGYAERVRNLKDSSLRNIRLTTDNLRGDISAKKPKLLCIAIPYSSGWTAKIDGKDADTFCINTHYIGLDIPPGNHSISLHYRTPHKTEGFLVSLAGLLALVLIILGNHFLQKRRQSNAN